MRGLAWFLVISSREIYLALFLSLYVVYYRYNGTRKNYYWEIDHCHIWNRKVQFSWHKHPDVSRRPHTYKKKWRSTI